MMKQKIPVVLTVLLIVVLSCSPVSAKTFVSEEVSIDYYHHEVLSFIITKNNAKVRLSVEEFGDDDSYGLNIMLKNEANYNFWLLVLPSSQSVFSAIVQDAETYKVELGSADTYYIILSNYHFSPSLQVSIKVTSLTIGETVGIVIGAVVGVAAVVAGLWFFYFRKKNKGVKIK